MRSFTLFVLAIAVLCASTVRAADLPPDLALVPPDAAGFVHVRVGEIYKSEHLKQLREIIAKAGPEALKAFSERFVPDPTTLDRLTVYAVMMGDRPPLPTVIVRLTKPFDAAKLIKSLAPKAEPMKAGSATFYVDRDHDMAVRVLDDRMFQISPAGAMQMIVSRPRSTEGPLAPALARAAGKPVFVAFNAAAIPPQLRAQIPAPAVPIAKLKLATIAVDLGASAKIDVRLSYPDADAAADAEQMIHSLFELGRSAMVGARAEMQKRLEGAGEPSTLKELPEATGALVALGALRQYEDLLKALPLKRDGADISLVLDVPPGMQTNAVAVSAVAVGLLLPAVQKVREAGGRSQGANNLKQMALAMHNYNDMNVGNMPAHAIYSKDGKTPLLSWRIAILPYLEQDELYKQFHLDEPWDSEHNLKLAAMMPRVYLTNAPPQNELPGMPAEPGKTYYQVFVGGGAAWDRGPKGPGMPRSFVDGTSNTIMIAEAGDPVIWTKPDDLPYDPKKPLPRLGNIWNKSGFLVALADGSVRSISPTISEVTLRAAITRAGNEILGADW